MAAAAPTSSAGWMIFARDTIAATVILLWASQNVASLCEVSGRSMQPALNPDAVGARTTTTTTTTAFGVSSLMPRFNDRVLATRWAAR